MEEQLNELTVDQMMQYLKKHPQSISILKEDFAIGKRDFTIHNLQMRGQPTCDFDIVNFRRGEAFIQEIANSKEVGLRVARKGLRKIYDLLPEYLDIKNSFKISNQHCGEIKNRILNPLKISTDSYVIYNSEKANGQNVQVSWDEDGKFWVFGLKNQTLILTEVQNIKYLIRKHEYAKLIVMIEEWFKFLSDNPDKVQIIKKKLQKYTLVGQMCDSIRNGQIINYGLDVKFYFYALVRKDQQKFSCEPPWHFLQFVKQTGLSNHCVKFRVNQVQTYEALIEQLKIVIKKTYEGELEQSGEGVVIYISTKQKGAQCCRSVIKIKTLQYRIYYKLKESLRAFFEKYRKSYVKILNKFIQQTKQMCKGFKTPKPQNYYINLSKKAFEYCDDQQKIITKYVINNYISFIKIIQNQQIPKQNFKKIVYQQLGKTYIEKQLNDKQQIKQKTYDNDNIKCQIHKKIQLQIDEQITTQKLIKIAILVPLAIPGTGKSTLFKKIKQSFKEFYIQIISSDSIRLLKMQQLMKKHKNISKKESFQKTRVQAQKQFYKQLGETINRMSINKEFNNCILILDKNHPSNTLKGTIQQLSKLKNNIKNAEIKVVCVVQSSGLLKIQKKSKYLYPFSVSYIACCMKRVIARQQHETLEGTVLERANICINFANMFRNFHLSSFNLSKYFNGIIPLYFTKQQSVPIQIQNQIMKILMGSKPHLFDQHEGLGQLVQSLKQWEYCQINFNDCMDDIHQMFLELFANFKEMKIY